MIGVLNAYHFDFTLGNYQEDYNRDVDAFLLRTFPSQLVRQYKIAKGEWPLSFDECHLWVITGSAKGAYEEVPWIHRLEEWVRELHLRKKKLIGICFGHQIIARALGGKVERSEKGWGVGIQKFQILKPQSWMQPAQTEVSLLFSHQDQVVELPNESSLLAQDEIHLLAQNDFCPNQMFQIGRHILTMQGHPEFSVEFAKNRLVSRREKIDPAVYDRAMSSFALQHDSSIISHWLREFAKL